MWETYLPEDTHKGNEDTKLREKSLKLSIDGKKAITTDAKIKKENKNKLSSVLFEESSPLHSSFSPRDLHSEMGWDDENGRMGKLI